MNRLHVVTATILGAALLAGPAAAGQATPAATAAPAPAAASRFQSPIKGQAELGYYKPVTKRDKDMVVTKIDVKNLSAGPIAGLKVEEFWYDKAGDPVTGSNFRNRALLQPGETLTVTLNTPYNAKMNANNYVFSHANGTIKTTLIKPEAPAKKKAAAPVKK
jgi:hypothetical protein